MKILIIGGNRFFGKTLAQRLLFSGHEVTLLNRGQMQDGLSERVERIQCNRRDRTAMADSLEGKSWDLVFDQVCFDYSSAKEACELFLGKTKRYIFTSSQSVYELGSNLHETDFDPQKHIFDREETRESNYAEAKRQAEVGFHRHAQFPVTSVRFPIVIGTDDYTKRFQFHVDRIRDGRPIYFPNSEAKMSFISSDFAAEALEAFVALEFTGAINVASPEPIRLDEMLRMIEGSVGAKTILAENEGSENHSPYGIDADWFMNCDRLKELGIVGGEIKSWLPEILGTLSKQK